MGTHVLYFAKLACCTKGWSVPESIIVPKPYFLHSMFQITDKLATHGLGETTYPATKLRDGLLEDSDFWIVDVRDMLDEPQDIEVYKNKIDYAISCLQKHGKIVICCGAGQSRSPAIAIGVLLKHYKMDYYDAYNLVHERVPIAEIEPCHINKLKKMFSA